MFAYLLPLLFATTLAQWGPPPPSPSPGWSPSLGCGSDLRAAILQRIFQNYDKDVRPPPGDGPTQVVCNAAILSISAVNAANYYMQLSTYIREQWNDTRLAYADMVAGCPNFNYISLITVDEIAQVWKPNLFFPDAISGTVLDTLQYNQVVRIYPDGSMLVSTHPTVQLYCSGDGSKPGQLTCPMKLYSYGLEVNELQLSWLPVTPIQLVNNIYINGYTLGSVTTQLSPLSSWTGNYSQIEADFNFIKKAGVFGS